jgi:transcriptional regulator with XRE-family HTH domain
MNNRNIGPRGPYRRWKGWVRPGATIGQMLNAARQNAGLTQAQLAEKTGINRSRLAQFETGKRHVPWPQFEKIKAAVDPDGEILRNIKSTWAPSYSTRIAVTAAAAARG